MHHSPSTAQAFPGQPFQLESFLWKLLLVTSMIYLVWSEKISIAIVPVSTHESVVHTGIQQGKRSLLGFFGALDDGASTLDFSGADQSNIAHLLATDIAADERAKSLEKCAVFARKFAPIAIAEKRRYGVPASILLAQALLSSNAGDLALAAQSNNYFLRPCGGGDCAMEHVLAGNGESVVDVFDNMWGSFRAQSLFLRRTEGYRDLFSLGHSNYKEWASGLDALGYAADGQYAAKLVAVIEALNLQALDSR